MKYMMLVHHDEESFVKITKDKQQQMLGESVALTQQLHHYWSDIQAVNSLNR
jgi:hypothetical protein